MTESYHNENLNSFFMVSFPSHLIYNNKPLLRDNFVSGHDSLHSCDLTYFIPHNNHVM